MFLIELFISAILVCKFLAAISHALVSLIYPASVTFLRVTLLSLSDAPELPKIWFTVIGPSFGKCPTGNYGPASKGLVLKTSLFCETTRRIFSALLLDQSL
jgi:hypothetical protein